MSKISQQSKILCVLFWFILIFKDAGTFGILPINIFQMIELLMFIVICVYNPKLKIDKKILFFFLYVGIVTSVQPFDFDSLKSFIFIFLSIVMYYLYLQRVPLQMTISAIFNAAFVLSVYGCVQEIGFILNIPVIYDISQYGFTLNGFAIGYGSLMRVNSLYAEPSHLQLILGLGILIGLIECKKCNNGVRIWQVMVVAICALLTQSFLVYMSVIMSCICFILFYQDNIKQKFKWFILATLICAFLCTAQWDFINRVFGKVTQFKTLQVDNGNDLSALAIVSNLRVAIEKMKEGHLFGTGLDSHRLYYDMYIDRLYTFLYMRLNSEDAASMYIRILSEFGVIGLIVFCGCLVKRFKEGLKNKNRILVVVILTLAVGSLRDGNYTQPLIQIMMVGVMFPKSVECSMKAY